MIDASLILMSHHLLVTSLRSL